MKLHLRHEKMNRDFSKWHIGGLPFDAVIHRFKSADLGRPHDHPFSFTSHILSGGYIEKVYRIAADGTWSSETIHRLAGTSHHVSATTIHEIVELPHGECWTLITPGKWERHTRFWKFTEKGIYFRQWNERAFRKLNK